MINTITLNPAIDHILYLNRMERNVTNRVRSAAVSIGGKGTHVSVNLAVLGAASRAFGFCFGRNGRLILDILEQAGVLTRFVYAEGKESRDNYLLVEEDTRDCTLIAQQGPQPNEEEMAAFLDMLSAQVQPGDDLLLSGDVSNFPGRDVYGEILDLLAGKNLRVFLDASGPSLAEGVKRKPYFIKPNLDELAHLTGETAASDKDVVRAILRLEHLGIAVVAVSLGDKGSIVRADGRMYRAEPPRVQAYNTAGCGDCFVAGFLQALEAGQGLEDCIRLATAVSAAKAESPLSVGFDRSRADELLGQVTVRRM